MKKNGKAWLRRILLVLAVVCALVAVKNFADQADSEEAYDQAAQIAFQGKKEDQPAAPAAETEPQETEPQKYWIPAPIEEEDKNIQKLEEIDLDALRQVNPDVVGWLYIPGTRINYPIMHGEDNEFYLKHTWQGKKNGAGSVFVEHRNQTDFTEFNTILYAHNMKNNTMFGDLDKYSSQWFWQNYPYVYVVNDAGIFRYEVFACHKAKVDSFVYGISFNQRATRENFIDSALEAARYETGITPAITDRILTMSTCTGGTYESRWVVHARLKMVLEE